MRPVRTISREDQRKEKFMERLELTGRLTKFIGLHYETKLEFNGVDSVGNKRTGLIQNIMGEIIHGEGNPGRKVKIIIEKE